MICRHNAGANERQHLIEVESKSKWLKKRSTEMERAGNEKVSRR